MLDVKMGHFCLIYDLLDKTEQMFYNVIRIKNNQRGEAMPPEEKEIVYNGTYTEIPQSNGD